MDNTFVGVFSIGQTLDRGIRLYKQAFSRAALFLLVPSLFGVFSMSKAMFPDPNNPFAMFGPAYFISMLLGMWSGIVIIRYLHKLSLGEQLTSGQMLLLAGPRDLLYILTYFIAIMVMVISILPLAIPLIYLMNISYIAAVIAVIERKYFFGWLGRAFSLTRKRWWKTFVINLVTFLIFLIPVIFALSLMMMSVAGSAFNAAQSMAEGGTPMTGGMKPMAVIGSALYIAVISLLTPLFLSINVIHYNSLRSEKENIDIERDLEKAVAQSA